MSKSKYHSLTSRVLKQYPNYEIHQNGNIVSRRTGNTLLTVIDTPRTETVRVVNRNGKRVRVPVDTLVQKAFGN